MGTQAWTRKVEGADSVQRHFQDAFGCALKLDWIQRWQQEAERGNAANSTMEDALEAVLGQDLRDCVERGSLQSVCLEDVKGRLDARYLVQVIEAVDVSRPIRTRYTEECADEEDNPEFKGPKKRCLKMTLTDGENVIQAIEYRKINDLNVVQKQAGVKIVLSGPVVLRRGILILTPETVRILGGHVHALEAARRTAVETWNKPDRKSSESRSSRVLKAVRQQFGGASARPTVNDSRPTPITNTSARPTPVAPERGGSVSRPEEIYLDDAIVLDEDRDLEMISQEIEDEKEVVVAIDNEVKEASIFRSQSSQGKATRGKSEVAYEFAPSIRHIPPGQECAVRMYLAGTKRDPVTQVCSITLEDGWPRSSNEQVGTIIAGSLLSEVDKSVSVKKEREFANMMSSFCAYALVYKPRSTSEPLQLMQLNAKVSKLKIIRDLIPKAFPEKADDPNSNVLDSFLTDEEILWE